MKETIKVSIAGIGFVLDRDAYAELSSYLDTLEKSYGKTPEGKEIIADIEARIVELILSHQSAEQVVEQPLVSEIIGQMGVPDETDLPDAGKYVPSEGVKGFPRRLYRNKEGAKLGGVCSGLGTYFGIDPVWIRLIFFAPLIVLIIISVFPGSGPLVGFLGTVFGAFFLLYFILWFAVPVAKTARQKLEMRGEAVTTQAIEQAVVRQEGERLREDTDSIFARLFSALGRIILFCIKAVVLLVGFCLAVTAVGLIVAMIAVAFNVTLLSSFDGVYIGHHNLIDIFAGIRGMSAGTLASLAIAAVLIPLIMLVYGIVCLVFNSRVNRTVMWILGGAWLVVVIFSGVTVLNNLDKIRDNIEYGYENLEEAHDWRNVIHDVAEGTLGTVIVDGDTLVKQAEIENVKEALEGVNAGYKPKVQLTVDPETNRFVIDIIKSEPRGGAWNPSSLEDAGGDVPAVPVVPAADTTIETAL